MVKAGNLRGFYPQGVGAVELAKALFRAGKVANAMKWTKKAESAWLKFFKEDSNWYNSYCWYAKSLGFQGKQKQMDAALAQGAKIAGKSQKNHEFQKVRDEVNEIRMLYSKFEKVRG